MLSSSKKGNVNSTPPSSVSLTRTGSKGSVRSGQTRASILTPSIASSERLNGLSPSIHSQPSIESQVASLVDKSFPPSAKSSRISLTEAKQEAPVWTAPEEPKYTAHRNSLNLQHPQPRSGKPYRAALEEGAEKHSEPSTPDIELDNADARSFFQTPELNTQPSRLKRSTNSSLFRTPSVKNMSQSQRPSTPSNEYESKWHVSWKPNPGRPASPSQFTYEGPDPEGFGKRMIASRVDLLNAPVQGLSQYE